MYIVTPTSYLNDIVSTTPPLLPHIAVSFSYKLNTFVNSKTKIKHLHHQERMILVLKLIKEH